MTLKRDKRQMSSSTSTTSTAPASSSSSSTASTSTAVAPVQKIPIDCLVCMFEMMMKGHCDLGDNDIINFLRAFPFLTRWGDVKKIMHENQFGKGLYVLYGVSVSFRVNYQHSKTKHMIGVMNFVFYVTSIFDKNKYRLDAGTTLGNCPSGWCLETDYYYDPKKLMKINDFDDHVQFIPARTMIVSFNDTSIKTIEGNEIMRLSFGGDEYYPTSGCELITDLLVPCPVHHVNGVCVLMKRGIPDYIGTGNDGGNLIDFDLEFDDNKNASDAHVIICRSNPYRLTMDGRDKLTNVTITYDDDYKGDRFYGYQDDQDDDEIGK